MIRRVVAILTLVGFGVLAGPVSVEAGPKEEVAALFDRFLAAFTAADVERVVALFEPDALVWGTTMTDLATTPAGVRQYFNILNGRRPNERRAAPSGLPSVVVLSDTSAALSGMWTLEQSTNGQPSVTTFRVSIAATNKGGRWAISQFHNSPRPAPPPATPR